jgi:hypothetical protein
MKHMIEEGRRIVIRLRQEEIEEEYKETKTQEHRKKEKY